MNMLIEVDGLLRVPENKYYDDNVVTSYKGRTIDTSEPIIVYRNLTRKGKVYSIKQGGLVVAHATAICVRDVEFIVNIKGKIRVMKSKKRNVHAYVKGYYTTSGVGVTAKHNLPLKIKYDPFNDREFYMDGNDIMDISSASFVIANEGGLSGSHVQTKIRS